MSLLDKKKVVIVVASILLAGCQTLGGYEVALEDTSVSPSMKSKSTVSTLKADTNTYEPSQYKVANLKPSERPSTETDEAGLWMLVDNYEERLATSAQLYERRELQNYLKEVTCRIADKFCYDIRVYVVHNPFFNASMMPNGLLQIHTGLLLRVHNEAQLAAILGHEIGHYLRRHSLQRMIDIREKAAASVIFQLAMVAAGTPEFNDLVNKIILGSIFSFGRDHEREADGYGLVLMKNAGYDTLEAHKVWDNLIRERDAGEGGTSSIFYSTHPPSEERRDALKEIAARLRENSNDLDKGQSRFRQAISRYRGEFLGDELALGKFETSKELLTLLLEGGFRKSETLYFFGELYRLRAEESDIPKAMEFYEQAGHSGIPPAELHRSKGLIYWRNGQKNRARESFRAYLKLKPEAPDAKMIWSMIGEKK